MKTFDEFALDAEALKHVSGGASQKAMDQMSKGNKQPGGIVDYAYVDFISFVEDKTGEDIDEEKVVEIATDFIETIKKKKKKGGWGKWSRG